MEKGLLKVREDPIEVNTVDGSFLGFCIASSFSLLELGSSQPAGSVLRVLRHFGAFVHVQHDVEAVEEVGKDVLVSVRGSSQSVAADCSSPGRSGGQYSTAKHKSAIHVKVLWPLQNMEDRSGQMAGLVGSLSPA